MERFEHDASPEPNIERDTSEWCYEKKDGRWQQVPLSDLGYLDPATFPEKDRRRKNFMRMHEETAEQWKLNDESIAHNEGFLRDHPRYHDLFIKWAMRYLLRSGLDKNKYSGKIDEDEGNLLQSDGRRSKKWLVNVVANGREWIDENIEMELRITEGFVDITHDYEKLEKLGIEPEHYGWWTQDEI
mgnify:CR=1 FL=1